MKQAKRVYEQRELVPGDYFRRLNRKEIFPEDRPLEIDVGSGDGGFLLRMAELFPDSYFLGIERLLGRVRKTCRKAERRGADNVRVLRLEASYALDYLMPPNVAHRIHLLFPDPWPKKRHQSRRFLQPVRVETLAGLLEPDGEFLFKSDHAECFEKGRETVRASGLFEESSWPENAFLYAQTDFERLWREEGRTIYRARFRRVHALNL